MTLTATVADYRKIAASVRIPSKAYIDGKSRDAISGAVFENSNPATGQVLGTVAACDGADVDAAVKAARKAFDSGIWSRASPEFRRKVLLRLADLVSENADELAVLEALDSGKAIKDCLHEIGNEVPAFFRWYAELIDKTFDKVVPTGENALALIVSEPVGVVGAVVPWNFPLLMATWKLAPALAAGCSVVLKPAEQTPLTALRLAELASQAGLSDGVLNVVPGYGQTAGQALGRHSDVDVLTFTGSNEVGALFLKYSSESNMKSVGLEMGGKSPFIVLDDAALTDDLIESAVMSAFWNAGQNCSANMRQIIDAKIKDSFLDKVIARTRLLRVGDPLDPQTEIGSMVSSEQHTRVMNYIRKGRSEGAVMVTGTETLSRDGLFIQPTIFDAVKPEMTIAKEEIFGPVLGIMSVNGLDQALQLAKDTDYGLHATVFTNDIDRAIHFARRLPCGTVAINGFSEGDVKTPFGGYRRSGSLARDKGIEALSQYSQTKTVWVSVRAPR
jgi:aldehyde dehydrogenase (NAD+)/gamma-glutamyl-gamma-aminobutyraldehyde dehydrogenase